VHSLWHFLVGCYNVLTANHDSNFLVFCLLGGRTAAASGFCAVTFTFYGSSLRRLFDLIALYGGVTGSARLPFLLHCLSFDSGLCTSFNEHAANGEILGL